MADWKIKTRTPECSTCSRAFPEGERHVSALSLQGEELQRFDCCEACFRPEAGREDLFFWYARSRPGKTRALEFDLPTLEQLFLGLEGRAERRIREMRYVLCLILMRKRRLKLQRVERGSEGEAMLVRRPRREESLRVFVFDFSPERLEELRHELLQVFEGADPALVPEPVESAAGVDSDVDSAGS
ncbi:MAG: hypothetical protein IPJ19_11385 [Planctomycetes bacterium]|nr:hypothetical protein [Planctomycetota bacterium]